MDFFAAQANARKRSIQLLLLFVLAVIAIGIAVFLATGSCIFLARFYSDYRQTSSPCWTRSLFLASTLASFLLIAASAYKKWRKIRKGCRAVAFWIGAKRLSELGNNIVLDRLQNILEEVAIAAGQPVPEAYVLTEETSINAFAVGHSDRDTGIIITAGALKHLNRDELQGLIAHEFGHILHRDVAINTRLVSMVFGINIIRRFGAIFLFAFTYDTPATKWPSTRLEAALTGALKGVPRRARTIILSIFALWVGIGLLHFACIVLGLPLREVMHLEFIPKILSYKIGQLTIGELHLLAPLAAACVGTAFFCVGQLSWIAGQAIQAAVCRQRELLADATAVQLTRYPKGLADALIKISQSPSGSFLQPSIADNFAHMCFADSQPPNRRKLLQIHPSLASRIRMIDPQNTAIGSTEYSVPSPPSPTTEDDPWPTNVPAAALELEELPEALRAAARDTNTAPTLLLCLVLSPSAGEREKQLAKLSSSNVADALRSFEPATRGFSLKKRFMLGLIAAPALRLLPSKAINPFLQNLDAIIDHDQTISISEGLLQPMILCQLLASRNLFLPQLGDDTSLPEAFSIICSTLARIGSTEPATAEQIFDRCTKASIVHPLVYRPHCTSREFRNAIVTLTDAEPTTKDNLLALSSSLIQGSPGTKSLIWSLSALMKTPSSSIA